MRERGDRLMVRFTINVNFRCRLLLRRELGLGFIVRVWVRFRVWVVRCGQR